MNVYVVDRTGEKDAYDEVTAVVVIAPNETEALALAVQKFPQYEWDASVYRVATDMPGIVMAAQQCDMSFYLD